MNYFVSYEILNPTADYKLVTVGAVVITNATVAGIMADLEAIKNDLQCPDLTLRVLCLTVLPNEL